MVVKLVLRLEMLGTKLTGNGVSGRRHDNTLENWLALVDLTFVLSKRIYPTLAEKDFYYCRQGISSGAWIPSADFYKEHI